MTIYAKDQYGIFSAPNTLHFNVKVFPTVTVLAVSVAVVALVVVGLLVYPLESTETDKITDCKQLWQQKSNR